MVLPLLQIFLLHGGQIQFEIHGVEIRQRPSTTHCPCPCLELVLPPSEKLTAKYKDHPRKKVAVRCEQLVLRGGVLNTRSQNHDLEGIHRFVEVEEDIRAILWHLLDLEHRFLVKNTTYEIHALLRYV